jgi:hypothetical protein
MTVQEPWVSTPVKSADESVAAIHDSLRELREIRDRIFGLSGQAEFLELTEADASALRTEAHQLHVKITTGDVYNTNISDSTIGAAAIGAGASARGTATATKGPRSSQRKRGAASRTVGQRAAGCGLIGGASEWAWT